MVAVNSAMDENIVMPQYHNGPPKTATGHSRPRTRANGGIKSQGGARAHRKGL
jgi:hypothetical protein